MAGSQNSPFNLSSPLTWGKLLLPDGRRPLPRAAKPSPQLNQSGEALRDCKTSAGPEGFGLGTIAAAHLGQAENPTTWGYPNTQAKRGDAMTGGYEPLHDHRSYFLPCFSTREPLPDPKLVSDRQTDRQTQPAGEHQETVGEHRAAQHALLSAHGSHNRSQGGCLGT